jgi:parallel beta-helix repeat protein
VTLIILIASFLVSAYSLKTANASSTIYIRPDGSIDPAGAPIQRDGNVYTLTGNINSDIEGIVIERNYTVLDGAGFIVEGTGASSSRGIYLSEIYNATVKNMKVKGFESGILLDTYSSYNKISGNRLEGNDYGINCWGYADNNTILGNNITSNSLTGIWIVGSSSNSVTENNIIGNGQYGISLESSSNDSVYHNNFIDNTNQVTIYDSTITWDHGYPSGGNYWSDYAGTDAYSGPNQDQPGSDGIGDTPYNVSENNQDGYPLMQEWTNMAIAAISPSKAAVGQGQKVNITIIVQNQGWDAVTTSVTLYANTTILSSFTNIALSERTQTTLNYTWQTASFDKAKYFISANATAIPGETNTADNNMTGGSVLVTIPGDINGDGTVNILDAITLGNAFLATPGSSNWNPNADINSDNTVNILDAIILANHFLQQYP